jgi:uncharacterized protein YukE
MANIHVDPEKIADAEAKIEAVRTAFESEWPSAKAAVMECGWEGAAAAAFQGRFDEFDANVPSMMEQVSGIASMLKSGRDGLVTTDEQIAGGMAG